MRKKFLPLRHANERGLSSVGLERLLDRQEVGSSNLPVLTTRKRHLQRCRCLFFLISKTYLFRQTAARESSLYVLTTRLRCAEGRNRPVAHHNYLHNAQNRSLGAAIWRHRVVRQRWMLRDGCGAGATTGFPHGHPQGRSENEGRGCGWRGPRSSRMPVARPPGRSKASAAGGCG